MNQATKIIQSQLEMPDPIEPGTAGPSFEDFLKGQGVFEETTKQALERVALYQRT